MAQIFVSYSRHDSEFVDKLIAELEKLGYSVWVDRQSIVGGEAWMASITEGIKQCQVYLIVLSPNSVASDNVARELMMAHEKKKPIIPIRLNLYTLPSKMEFPLVGLQWVDYHEHTFATGTEKLRQALTQNRIATYTPDPKPLPPKASISSIGFPPLDIIIGSWLVESAETNPFSEQISVTLDPNQTFKGYQMYRIYRSGKSIPLPFKDSTPIPLVGKWNIDQPTSALTLDGQINNLEIPDRKFIPMSMVNLQTTGLSDTKFLRSYQFTRFSTEIIEGFLLDSRKTPIIWKKLYKEWWNLKGNGHR
jgi:hypothetical protein